MIAFPYGNTLPEAKYAEAVAAMDYGAKEVDVVVNYGLFLGGHHHAFWDIAGIVKAAHPRGVLVKAILEFLHYTPDQLYEACRLCVAAGVDFVKTSTGFGPGGATPEAVKTMLKAVDGEAQVKASSGIKTYADAARYLDLGCTRLARPPTGSCCHEQTQDEPPGVDSGHLWGPTLDRVPDGGEAGVKT